ncbi:MAG: ABC transporter substrate-binding protein [Chloroflexota bacterium]
MSRARTILRKLGWRRPMLALLCLILTAMFFYDWLLAQPFNDGTWDRVRKNGVLRIGMDASYPPFGNTPNGQPVGLDVDLANEIGRRLGVRIEIANMGFDGLYDALKTAQVDALISALSFNPTKGNVLYTQSYFDAGQILASRDGHIATMNDLEGLTVAVEYGSVADEVVRVWQRRLHLLKVSRFTTSDEALAAASAGKTDAALTDALTARLYLRSHQGLVLSPTQVTHDPYSVAVRTSSYDLGAAISGALRGMQQDGTLTKILSRWL